MRIVSIWTLFLFLAFITMLVYSSWSTSKKWEVVYEASYTSMNAAHEKVRRLEASGVRCQIESVGPMITSPNVINPGMQRTVRVMVKKNDAAKAHQILAQAIENK